MFCTDFPENFTIAKGVIVVALYYIQANNGISDALRINDTLILALST